ncbi:hypothetical protein TNCV_3319461 [Trichonephila clavipes]|nr:hypothetical protein TNCV_3319461 [Trichonephila clavipes]
MLLAHIKFRSRAASAGEVLTKESILENLVAEESDRKNKFNEVNVKNDVKDTERNFFPLKLEKQIHVIYGVFIITRVPEIVFSKEYNGLLPGEASSSSNRPKSGEGKD